MQVYCRKTSGNAELHCCVCGQSFVIFWDRQTAMERAVARCEIQEMLRRQHRSTGGCEAHSQDLFVAPEWEGSVFSPSATVTGQVPLWEL